MKEEWRSLDPLGFKGYDISSLGRVRSYWVMGGGPRNMGSYRVSDRPQRILKQSVTPNGYKQVVLSRYKGKRRTRQIHRLVAEVFIGPCPDRMVTCHNDSDKGNNCASNLRYDTMSGNLADRDLIGTNIVGSRNGNSKLTASDVVRIRLLQERGICYSKIADKFGICKSTVGRVVNRIIWRHVL